MRILLPQQEKQIQVTDATGKVLQSNSFRDEPGKTYFLVFENNPDGVHVKLSW